MAEAGRGLFLDANVLFLSGAAHSAAEAAELGDAADVPILAAAIQCGADILVTGDRWAFGRFFRTRVSGVEVLSLRDALRRVVDVPLE